QQLAHLGTDVVMTAFIWYAMFVAYAMFIPNTWRRAALVIVPMAIAALVLPFGAVARYASVAAALSPTLLSAVAILMIIGAGSAIYGTYIINTLRAQTFESEERSRALFQATPEGIIVTDAHGIIASFNPAAEQLFGYRADQVLGKHVQILVPRECWEKFQAAQ